MVDARGSHVELRQFYLESLGHASYLVGSDDTGEALVLDPRRDVDVYLDAAAERGLRIAHIIDTHQHNDYLSGICELADRTGARVLGSAHADLGYQHEPVKNGQQFEMGEVGVEVRHTPGHTPEHMSLVIYDGEQSADEPAILLSGGALLVGDVARPDLLGSEEDTRRSAEAFCETIRSKLLTLPDHTLVYPTHVAGSLCGGRIGSRLATTVGYERRVNPVLRKVQEADETPTDCLDLEDLPAVPPYWPRMRTANERGPDLLGAVTPPPAMGPDDFAAAADREAGVVLDARSPEAFAAAHVPGAVNVALGSSFATWAGSILPADAEILLVLDTPDDLMEATWQLLRIGYERPVAWLAGGMYAYRTSGREIDSLPATTVHDVRDRIDDYHVLDVRQPAEWSAYRAPGAQFLTGAQIVERLDEVPGDRDVLVVCGSGFRSSVAASVLKRAGHERVTNLLGGMTAWRNVGLPLE